MKELTKELLELSRQVGVSGREGPVADYLEGRLADFGECTRTALGSLICTLRPQRPKRPRLLLVAHMDEVGLVVTHITEDGFLKVNQVGGLDPKLFAASSVEIHTRSGVLPGVVCSTPPHLIGDGDIKVPKVDEIYIDTGLSGERARERIALGDVITMLNHPKTLLDGTVSGKALDDRACCAAILRMAELLDGEELDCGLTAVFSTMEETGSQGARTAAYLVDPTHAMALDVSFGHSPDDKLEQCGKIKKGPMVGIAPILDNGVTSLLLQLCEEQDIPHQLEVMNASTGTDADSIAVTRGGVRTGLISIPLRYMHSPVECVAPCDVEQTAKLLVAWVRAMAAAPIVCEGGER